MRPIPGGHDLWEQKPPRRSQSWGDPRGKDSPTGSRKRASQHSPAPCVSNACPPHLSPALKSQAEGNEAMFLAFGWETLATIPQQPPGEGLQHVSCLPPGTREGITGRSRSCFLFSSLQECCCALGVRKRWQNHPRGVRALLQGPCFRTCSRSLPLKIWGVRDPSGVLQQQEKTHDL